MLIIGQFNRVDRAGDTMEGILDFDTFAAQFTSGFEIEKRGSGLGFTVGSLNALRIDRDADGTDLIFEDSAIGITQITSQITDKSLNLYVPTGTPSGTIKALKLGDGLLDTSSVTADTTLQIKAGQAFLVNDGTTDLIDVNASGLILTATGARINEFSTDGTLAGDSDTALPTEKAVKTYVDSQVAAEDLWDRAGTILTPHNTTDDQLDFSGAAGDMTLKIKGGQSFLLNDGTNDILKSSDGALEMRAPGGFADFVFDPVNGHFLETDNGAGGFFIGLANKFKVRIGVAGGDGDIRFFDSTGGGGTHCTIGNDGSGGMHGLITSGQSFKVNDGTTDLIDVNASGLILTATGARINEFSTDGTLAGDSDTALPTEKAVKTYVDSATGQTREVFYMAELNGNLGDLRVRTIAQNGSFNFNFFVPDDFGTLTELVLVGIPSAGAAGSGKDIDLASEYGAIGQSRTTHSESDAATTYDFTGDTDNFVEIDVSGVFSSLAAGDYGGLLLTHNTIGGSISYLGIRLKYTT